MNFKKIEFAIRFGMATVFLYAAMTKFFQSLNGQGPATLFSEWIRFSPSRYILICGETLLALWLFSGIKRNNAGIVALCILSAFCGLIISELGRKYPEPCGCMGAQVTSASPQAIHSALRFDLLRNVLMIAGAVWLSMSASPGYFAEFSVRFSLGRLFKAMLIGEGKMR